jgi:hypothetical protein
MLLIGDVVITIFTYRRTRKKINIEDINMKKHITKKLLSAFLALIFALSLSTFAFAAGGVREIVTEYGSLWKTSDIVIKVGETVRWYVNVPTGTTPKGCGGTVKIPGYNGWTAENINVAGTFIQLSEGKNYIYELTPTETGDIVFSCRMGPSCHSNKIHVIADDTPASGGTGDGNSLTLDTSDSSGTTEAIFDLRANLSLSNVNLIEVTLGYDAAHLSASAVLPQGLNVEKYKIGDGTITILVGLAGKDAAIAHTSVETIAAVSLVPVEGYTDEATLKIISFTAKSVSNEGVVSDAEVTVINSTATFDGFEEVIPDDRDPLDVNDDTLIDLTDLSLALYYFGYIAAEIPEGIYADVNSDGNVDSIDITILVNFLYPLAA